MFDLLATAEITLQPGNSFSYDEDGNPITKSDNNSYTLEGSLQPFWKQSSGGRKRVSLPDGVAVEDILVFYSRCPVRTTSMEDATLADKAEIDGLMYYAYISRNWARNGLDLDHYETFFVLYDQSREDIYG